MRISVEVIEDGAKLPLPRSDLEKVVNRAIKRLERSPQYLAAKKILGAEASGFSLKFCRDPEMRALNYQYRKLDRTTDVLSFPAIEMGLEGAGTDPGYLGDLVMSEDALKRGALKMKHSYVSEFVEVLIHGLLHLLGFDHLKKGKEAELMFAWQGELFSQARSDINLDDGKRARTRRSTSTKPSRARRKIKRTKRKT